MALCSLTGHWRTTHPLHKYKDIRYIMNQAHRGLTEEHDPTRLRPSSPGRLQQMTLPLNELLDGLRAAAEPTRLRLLAICAEGELTVSEITRILGQSQPRVSRHLRLLARRGSPHQLSRTALGLLPHAGQGSRGASSYTGCSSCCRPMTRRSPSIAHVLEQVQAERRARGRRLSAFQRRGLGAAARSAGRLRRRSIARSCAELGAAPLGDLLDIGTGTGRLLKLLGKGARAPSASTSPPRCCWSRATNLHAAGLKEVTLRQGDMYHLPFADAVLPTRSPLDQVLRIRPRIPCRRRGRSGAPAATGRAAFWSWTTRAARKRSDRASIHARRRSA